MSSGPADRAAVIGAGSWGTALAIHLGGSGREVTLWGRDAALMSEMATRRANPTYLSEFTFPDGLEPVGALDAALAGVRYVIFAVPSHGLRAVVHSAAPFIPAGAVLVSATKGLETDTRHRMSEVIAEETGSRHPVVVLSGPSFAAEVARQLPTALVAASSDADAVRAVQHEFRGAAFRLYASDDVVGVEIGAALKNIIAIAAGVVEGLGLGHNALAALITRGLAELTRLGVALGARASTFAGLAGIGDLVLTCTGALSRNRAVGVAVGQGQTLDQALAGKPTVAEGVATTKSACALAAREGVEMPIAMMVHRILFDGQTPKRAITELMARELRPEQDE